MVVIWPLLFVCHRTGFKPMLCAWLPNLTSRNTLHAILFVRAEFGTVKTA